MCEPVTASDILERMEKGDPEDPVNSKCEIEVEDNDIIIKPVKAKLKPVLNISKLIELKRQGKDIHVKKIRIQE